MPLEDEADRRAIQEIQEILAAKLLAQVDSPDEDLLQAGILDSLALIQLLVHLEERFGVKILLEELEIEDLRSVRSIARMVIRQKRMPDTPKTAAVTAKAGGNPRAAL